MDLYISTQDAAAVVHSYSRQPIPFIDLRNGYQTPFNLYFLSPDIHDKRAPWNLARYLSAAITLQLKQDGQSPLATQSTFTELVPNWLNNALSSATITVTIATPGVVTWTAHGFSAGQPVAFSTTGALPTGITPNQVYYVISPGANTFQLATAPGGNAIATSGSQSGVHTGYQVNQFTRITSGTSTKGEYDRVQLADVPASGSLSLNFKGGIVQNKGAASSTFRIYPGITTPQEVESAMNAIVGAPYCVEFVSPMIYDIHGSTCPGTAPFINEVNIQDLQFLYGWTGNLDLTGVNPSNVGLQNLYLIVLLTPSGGVQQSVLKLPVNLVA